MKNILQRAKRLYRLKLNQKLPDYKRFLYKNLQTSNYNICFFSKKIT
jgi:hypothetical protein